MLMIALLLKFLMEPTGMIILLSDHRCIHIMFICVCSL